MKNREAINKHTAKYHGDNALTNIPNSLRKASARPQEDRSRFLLKEPSSASRTRSFHAVEEDEAIAPTRAPPMMQRGGGRGGAWSWVNPNPSLPKHTPRGPSIMNTMPIKRDYIGDQKGREIHAFSRPLENRTQLVASLPDREGSNIELSRLGLLRSACESSDHFYLVLHQLFCWDHEVQKSKGQIPGLDEIHKKGLSVISFLLVSNDRMTDDAVKWFSLFPLSLEDLIMHKSVFATAYTKVLMCLRKMATLWKDIRVQCTKRVYPPLVDELIVLFHIESFLFQQIIFRAVLRDISFSQLDGCFQIIEDIFKRDYKDVMSRSSTDSTSNELVKLHQQTIVKEYQHALESHQQHTDTGSTSSMAPPLVMQNPTVVMDPAASNSLLERRASQNGGGLQMYVSPVIIENLVTDCITIATQPPMNTMSPMVARISHISTMKCN